MLMLALSGPGGDGRTWPIHGPGHITSTSRAYPGSILGLSWAYPGPPCSTQANPSLLLNHCRPTFTQPWGYDQAVIRVRCNCQLYMAVLTSHTVIQFLQHWVRKIADRLNISAKIKLFSDKILHQINLKIKRYLVWKSADLNFVYISKSNVYIACSFTK